MQVKPHLLLRSKGEAKAEGDKEQEPVQITRQHYGHSKHRLHYTVTTHGQDNASDISDREDKT